MRVMFPQVAALIRLLLVNPASSTTAEQSFSSLRRLKTYLRSTCVQRRLNNLAICHDHKPVMWTRPCGARPRRLFFSPRRDRDRDLPTFSRDRDVHFHVRDHKSEIETFFETKLRHFCIIRPTLIVLFSFYDFETITVSHWLAKTSL